MDAPRETAKNSFLEFASGLRFPWLLLITVVIFLIDLVVPDIIPFVDEILLGLFAIVLASIKKRRVSAIDMQQNAGRLDSPPRS